MRSLRGDNSSQGSGADLNATLTYMTKNMLPGQDPYLWDNRYNAIKELTKELAKVVVQKGPAAANQSMLQQNQELQRENARLKSARAGAPTQDPGPHPPRRRTAGLQKAPRHPRPLLHLRVQVSIQHQLLIAGPRTVRTLIRSLEDCWHPRNPEEAGSDQEHEQEHEPVLEEARDDEATIVPSPDFSPTDVLDQDFADPLETVQTFERTDQALFLEECKVDNYKMATINSWISHRVGKEKMPIRFVPPVMSYWQPSAVCFQGIVLRSMQ